MLPSDSDHSQLSKIICILDIHQQRKKWLYKHTQIINVFRGSCGLCGDVLKRGKTHNRVNIYIYDSVIL